MVAVKPYYSDDHVTIYHGDCLELMPSLTFDCINAGFAISEEHARAVCVRAFRDWLQGNRWADGSGPAADERHAAYVAALPELRGHDLACWCPLDQPCHADVLIELANEVTP